MAAEVPVKDVLCEAMEYLSKLGSNLQTRTENLKKKKIRKDKLSNVLALKSAANKVLLICELSKKSLQNVETGIRNVLQHVDTAQTKSPSNGSDGGKSSKERNDNENKTKYYYIEYGSRKLRMKNKINWKHYNSVKVYAKKIPFSMLLKYPVHYDCELYRQKRKQDLVINTVSKDAKNVPDTEENKNDSVGSREEEKTSSEGNQSPSKECETDARTSVKDAGKEQVTDARKSAEGVNADDIDCVSNNKETDEIEQSKDKDVSTDSDKKSNDKSKDTSKSNKISRKKSVQVLSDSSDSEVKKQRKKTRRHSSSSEERNPKRRKLNVIKDDSSSDDVVEITSPTSSENNDKTEKKTSDEEQSSGEKEPKPMIKCVNISKLLKPDILQKETVKKQITTDKRSESLVKQRQTRERIKKKQEDDYWALKRKEVKEFKPKKFTVKLELQPEFSVAYLEKHNIKKVTQNGKVIFEIDKSTKEKTSDKAKISEEKENNEKSKESYSDTEILAEANKIKSALLNQSDSDSDDVIKRNNEKTKEIKNALLFESDSDENKNTQPSNSDKSDSEKDKNTQPENSDKSDSEKDKNTQPGNSDKSDSEKDKNTQPENSDKSDSEKDKNTQPENSDKSDSEKDKNTQPGNSDKSDSEKDKNTQPDNSDKSDSEENKQASNTEKSDSEKNKKTQPSNSESDNDTQNKNDTETLQGAKQTLLAESDSDKNDKPENSDKNTDETTTEKCDEQPKESLKSDGSNNEKEKSPEKASESAEEKDKNTSSDDKTNTPLKDRQERKKRIRESIKAKKMLLTYSSSSETEDEQLRDALNEIKASLLKEVSDDENNLKSKVSEKLRRSSSSSDEILKKKKSKRSKSPESKRKRHKRRVSSSDEDSTKTSSRKMVRSKSKPGNCSSQNSDARDSDKDIDGLTNLNTLNKSRRRKSNDSEHESNTNNGDNAGDLGEYFESTGLIDHEVILKAESDSEAESGEEHDAGDAEEEDVVLPTLNGNPIEHLAKEDLLGESDSSVSHNEKSSVNANKDDTDEDAKLNSKRRKANAISSDSEAGSSRKKDRDVRLSDFEDSDDGSEPAKKSKRKKGSDSDGSAGSSSDGGKKKRRRIKQINDSDGSGSETETEGRNKHGRKNIRKVMGKNQLEEATKKAARQEKERIARIAERQKLYNNLEFDESGKPDEVVLEKVVLDFDPETKEPLIQVDRGLVKKLKPHQANGIKFMWDACFESVKRIKKDKGSGCILAHCMGLGKTLQVVSLTHTLLTHSSLTKVNRVLVVCPLSTVLNWVNEFNMWLKHADNDNEVDVYELSRFKQNSERAFQLSQWFQHGGVCVLGYEMFRNLSADNTKKFKKKMLKNFQESLVDPGPDLVVCDEGHLLKNEKTSLSQSMNRVKTLRRIVLTGTPLQNNLKEYYCMVQFVKPNLLGKYNEYLNRFVNPITNGQYTDSTEHDIKVMKRRSHVLHKMLDGAVQRRDYGVLAPFLPPKHEYVLFITLTEVQIKLYQYYLDNFSRRPLPGKSSGFLFPDFQSLQRIWTHPLVLKYNSERYEIMQQKKRDKEEEDSEGSLVDFIDDDSTPDESSTEESSDDLSDVSDDSRKKSKKKKSSKKNKVKDTKVASRRGTRANPIEQDEDDKEDDIIEVKNENPTEWWIKLVSEDELEDMRNSHKLILLFDILRQCEAIGDKLLVFSQSLYSLDLIEHFLGKVDEATQEGRIDEKLGNHVGSWSPGVDYFRLDGSTSCENRSIWCKNFNREDNPRARLFLISTRAGGLGINLVAANRVVIFDVSWNPSHDVQSIFRVYRFGQKKPCYIYRFLAMGTMEEKIYERQVTKQAISKRVIDEQQIDRHYAENDLAELYKFESHPPSPRPLPPLPKDRLFAEMLKEFEAQIYKYHEHDSLLENKEEETLSEEERKAAWEDFENEKNKPPPAPFPSPWPMHNGMVPNLLAQQQQQLAYAALASMLRKDMPNINDNQIRDMLPMIYNSNPGLMQKISEIYKYTQPGMMNHGMMNPMNSASGAGSMGGMGGTSGLQYEPPWQRQQQQQQQMRLQQLMQQQNQMGAKFYAGGLGSRDPVAMALQQQRAREIMLGGGGGGGGGGALGGVGSGAGRPRGRPPLQPRAPPAAHDVVNLDSD